MKGVIIHSMVILIIMINMMEVINNPLCEMVNFVVLLTDRGNLQMGHVLTILVLNSVKQDSHMMASLQV
jgi:hypothetical protein